MSFRLEQNHFTEFWKMGKEAWEISIFWEIWNAERGVAFLSVGRKYVRFYVAVAL